MSGIIRAAASGWGRCVAAYSRRAVSPERVFVVGEFQPRGTCLWVGWHEFNLLALAVHRVLIKRPVVALVPAGGVGAAMAGWLEGLGIVPIPMTRRGERTGLQDMANALAQGHDAVVAVDGPAGPRRVAKAGILWLASQTTCEIRAAAFCAAPALRLPRWDRQLIPLPGASVTAASVALPRAQLLDDRGAALEFLTKQLDDLSEQTAKSLTGAASGADIRS